MAEKPKAVRPKAKKPKLEDKDQSARFMETAREIGADESGVAFEKAAAKIVSSRPRSNGAAKI